MTVTLTNWTCYYKKNCDCIIFTYIHDLLTVSGASDIFFKYVVYSIWTSCRFNTAILTRPLISEISQTIINSCFNRSSFIVNLHAECFNKFELAIIDTILLNS